MPPAALAIAENAVKLLEPWLSGALGQELMSARRLERNFEWTLAWPIGSAHPTVFRGRAEYLGFDTNGGCEVVIFSAPGVDSTVERLRLLLAARAVEALGLGIVKQARRIVLGETSDLFEERELGDPVIAEVLAGLSR